MPTGTLAPPRTFGERLRFVGPGIVFASLAVGSGELILTPRAGALYGYALAWVALGTLVYKAAFTEGLARCTVATGNDIFISFNSVPGPRGWVNCLVVAIFALEALAYGGIALAAGTAVNRLFPGVDMRQAAVGIVLLVPIILVSGSYRVLEKVVLGIAAVLVGGVLYATWNVTIVPREVLAGFVPNIPDGSTLTIMGLMGWVGAGPTTLLYSSWLKEKIGGAPDESQYRGWITTVRLDCICAYTLIFLLSGCFLVLGATILHSQGLEPKREETMAVLSNMLGSVPYGRPVFLVTAFFTLFSTVLAGVDGKGRALASIVSSMTARFTRISIYRATMGVYLLIMLSAILLGQPVVLIAVIAAVVSVVFAMLGFILLYLDTTLPRYARGSTAWRALVLVGNVAFVSMAVYKIVT